MSFGGAWLQPRRQATVQEQHGPPNSTGTPPQRAAPHNKSWLALTNRLNNPRQIPSRSHTHHPPIKIPQSPHHPRTLPRTKHRNVPKKLPIQSLRTPRLHIRSLTSPTRRRPLQRAPQANPCRQIQPHHRIGPLQPFHQRAAIVPIHNPRRLRQRRTQHRHPFLARRFHPSRTPVQPVQMNHRQPRHRAKLQRHR